MEVTASKISPNQLSMDYIYKNQMWNSQNLAQFYWHAKNERKNEDSKKLIFSTDCIIIFIILFPETTPPQKRECFQTGMLEPKKNQQAAVISI